MGLGRQSGLMMSRENGYAVFLTATGKFVRGKAVTAHASVGEEVEFVPVRLNGVRSRTMGLVAGLVLALLLTGVSSYFTRPVVAAYITIDINPSLELGVDKHDIVRSAVALNDDGRRLLDGLALKGKPVTKAVGEIMALADKDGYLKLGDENLIVLTAVPVNGKEETNEALSQKIDQTVKESRGSQSAIMVTSLVATPQLRDEAQKQGISVGRLLIAKKAQEAGLHLDPVQLQISGLAQSIRSAGGEVQTLLAPKNEQDQSSINNNAQKSKNNGPSDADDSQDAKRTGEDGDKKQGDDDKSKTNGSQNKNNKSDKPQDGNQGNGKKK